VESIGQYRFNVSAARNFGFWRGLSEGAWPKRPVTERKRRQNPKGPLLSAPTLRFELKPTPAYKWRVSKSSQPDINAATRLCAVYGSPIAHSASPAMHNAAFKNLGLNWRYLAFEVDPKNLRTAIEGARAMNFAGLNLTVPHKLFAFKMVDELDKSAKMFGAVNTIKFETRGGKTRAVGFNTDADAIVRSIHEKLKLKLRGARVLLLGAGGAGRTAALKLASENVADLFLINRTRSKAEQIAREIRKRFSSVNVSISYPESKVDLILNATSLGLKPGDPSPLDEKQFSVRQARAVYDMIYRPAQTQLLAAAKKAGCKTANGLGMLLHQGAKAFDIWTGKTAPLDIMRKALESEVYGHQSTRGRKFK
jgi:shikimate dehydrogenase